MALAKLFRPALDGQTTHMAQIHADHYGCSYKHINSMIDVLKTDFPGIKDEDIQVQKYGGRHIKGITFVEVPLPSMVRMPEGYHEIHQLEYIL